jgi:hypothetical protein
MVSHFINAISCLHKNLFRYIFHSLQFIFKIHIYLLCVTNGLIINYIENSLIMNRIIKLFLVTFSFVILATSGVSRQAPRKNVKLRNKFSKYNLIFL